MVNEKERALFRADAAAFLDRATKAYVTTSRSNRLQLMDGGPIFGEPLVGFADGDDHIFQDYKTIIGDFHLTPREALARHLEYNGGGGKYFPVVNVISFVLPIAYKTRLSLRQETIVPSLRWNHTRWKGQDFIYELSSYVAYLLEDLGYEATVPELADFYKFQKLPGGYAYNWSQRHIAYAAGLGTFSVNDGLITPSGIAVRCGSVVTSAGIEPSPRPYKDYLANCLFYSEGCRRCMDRCPAGAITEKGHDKNKCYEFLMVRQKEILKEMGREDGYIGRYLGCGLCQTKVPCEDRIPPRIRDKRRK